MGVSFSPDECCGLIRMIALKGPRKFRAKTSLSYTLSLFIHSFILCVCEAVSYTGRNAEDCKELHKAQG